MKLKILILFFVAFVRINSYASNVIDSMSVLVDRDVMYLMLKKLKKCSMDNNLKVNIKLNSSVDYNDIKDFNIDVFIVPSLLWLDVVKNNYKYAHYFKIAEDNFVLCITEDSPLMAFIDKNYTIQEIFEIISSKALLLTGDQNSFYGNQAKSLLERKNLYHVVKNKLLFGNNASHVLELMQLGKTVAIINKSAVKDLEGIKILYSFEDCPEDIINIYAIFTNSQHINIMQNIIIR